MRRPTAWLFSGWNCTPRTLPRATTAAKPTPVPGEDRGLRLREHRGIPGEDGLGPHVAEGLDDAPQIADAGIDDRDHRLPLVLGTPFTRGSRATAMARARAEDLKRVSAIWWAFRPRIASRCRFSRPWSARAQKKSSNSSVGRSPTRWALKPTS